MKRYTLTILILSLMCDLFYASPPRSPLPDFIHATYIQGGAVNSENLVRCADYEKFNFIYIMAAPEWNKINFDQPIDNIYKLADSFIYRNSNLSLVPSVIEKGHKSDVKMLLSFAGEGFNLIVENPARRSKFIDYMIRLIENHNYDGIEIDWETGVELKLHAVFIHEIRLKLNKLSAAKNKYFYLTTALHQFQKYDQALADDVSKDVDWINIMTYDMGGGIWGNIASHNTPLADIKSALEHWNVFSKKQLCVGLANYGFRYKNLLPNQKIEGKLNKYGEYISYNKFRPLLGEGWTEEYDKSQAVSYYFSPDRTEFVTMENGKTLLDKIKWITSQEYLGVFWWEFHYDFIFPNDLKEQGKHHLIDIVYDYVQETKR